MRHEIEASEDNRGGTGTNQGDECRPSSLLRTTASLIPSLLGLGMMLVLLTPVSSWAHGFAGQRFFPTTFQVDDPFISDEFSVLIDRVKGPDAKTTEIDVDYSKRILPNFGLEFHEANLHLRADDGSSANGWDNLGVGAKWQFLTNAPHELILSVGTDFDIGGTGAKQVADSFTTVSPGLFFGKGLGDLPQSMNFFRPFAITGVVGPSFPTESTADGERVPTTLTWAFSLQYSFMYLQSFVKDIGLGAPFNRMILVTEFPMETCMSADCKGQITGTVNPGVVWCGKFMEFGVAAQVPVNSRSGSSVGVLGLFHLYVDDLFPNSIGGPIFH
jgi:hypothetical protein